MNDYFPAGQENIDDFDELSDEVHFTAHELGVSLEEAQALLMEGWSEYTEEV